MLEHHQPRHHLKWLRGDIFMIYIPSSIQVTIHQENNWEKTWSNESWALSLLDCIEWDLATWFLSKQVQYQNQQMDFAVCWRENSLDNFEVAVQFLQSWFAACWLTQKKSQYPTYSLSLSLALSGSNMAMDTHTRQEIDPLSDQLGTESHTCKTKQDQEAGESST